MKTKQILIQALILAGFMACGCYILIQISGPFYSMMTDLCQELLRSEKSYSEWAVQIQ